MSFSAVPITTVGRKLYLGHERENFSSGIILLGYKSHFPEKWGEHMSPSPPPSVPTALPINTDKESENKFFVFGPVKCFKNMSTSVSSSAQRFITMKCHIFLDS